MNDIRITVTLSLDEKHPEDAYIDFNLTIDGEYPHDVGIYIDPASLVNSAAMSGEFFIFTCDCGNPACKGIDDGVQVTHSGDSVKWRLRNPISWPPEEPMPEWTHDGEYTFEKGLYIQQVSTALDHAKRLARGFNATGNLWVGPDLTLQARLALEVPKPSGFFVPEPEGRALH